MKKSISTLLILVCLMLHLKVNAQNSKVETRYKKVSFEEVLLDIYDSTKSGPIEYKNLEFTFPKSPWHWLRVRVPEAKMDSFGRYIVDKSLIFKNCKFQSNTIKQFSFTKVVELYNCEGYLNINNCYINGYQYWGSGETNKSFSFEDNLVNYVTISITNNGKDGRFPSRFEFKNNIVLKGGGISGNDFDEVVVSGNKFGSKEIPMKSQTEDSSQFQYNGRIIRNNGVNIGFSFENAKDITVEDNTGFTDNDFRINNSNSSNIQIINNTMPSLQITNSRFEERLIIKGNDFTKRFGFTKTILPEFFVDINWEQIKNLKLNIIRPTYARDYNGYPYFGENEIELGNNDAFLELLDLHAKLYHNYKSKADIYAANGVYSKLQELYTGKYKYQYDQYGGLNNFFRWKLNQLLKFYINYGTDPARALVVSFYILLIFAIFYFFFPSEWDTISKKQLFNKLKSAIVEKEKGIGKTIYRVSGLFLLSLVNSLTLSLNAFVTLGFGTIPTKGIARYICVIEGFIGWFLLSLFTVALINQVIF